MKLDCVITSVNNNPLYIDFLPLFIKTWNKLYPSVDIKIILIHTEIPENIKIYEKNIILFHPLPNVSTSFTSQYIRLLYPALLNYKNGIMITDMDMLPMNRHYYSENIKHIPNNKFISMRNCLLSEKQIAICYCVASNKTWGDIFQIKTLEDVKTRLTKINNYYKNNISWFLDQIHLYHNVKYWNSKTNDCIILNDKRTKFNRLDRIYKFILNENTINAIKSGKYSDYHCYRPYNEYKEINEKVFELL
tara:strand:- start:1016 stop:1759 length:744 start_codon:yes stop_codon:yes gene_type:complete